MNNRRFYIAVLLMFACAAGLSAADVTVIANPGVGVSAVAADDLKAIFLLTRTALADGSHVEPVLAKGGPAHEAFLSRFLGKGDTALQTYYRSLVFTGKGSMPRTIATDDEMIAYVAKTKGAVGYIHAEPTVTSVKVLTIK